MEDDSGEETFVQRMTKIVKNAVFGSMDELLKELKIGAYYGGALILVMFLQMAALLFDARMDFPWRDDNLLSYFQKVADALRVLPLIEQGQHTAIFWLLYACVCFFVAAVIALLSYTIYCSHRGVFLYEWPSKVLRTALPLIHYALLFPFLETLIAVFRCGGQKHEIDASLECFGVPHIVALCTSSVFLLLLVGFLALTSVFMHETQPSQENALARVESSAEILLLVFRLGVVAVVSAVQGLVTQWIILVLYLIASTAMLYHYFVNVPYFNKLVSLVWGISSSCFLWITLNSVLTIQQVTFLSVGIPIVAGVVINLREKRLHDVLISQVDHVKSENEALNLLVGFQQAADSPDLSFIGIINLHVIECQNPECPCKSEEPMYDGAEGVFRDRQRYYHRDKTFVKHFCRRLHEDLLAKLPSSVLLHIAHSYYLFTTMRNAHAALVELDQASKKKPTLQQEFAIFRCRSSIIGQVKIESTQGKDAYTQLTNVIEFENLFGECQKSMETVTNYQIEFWTQVANQVPDLSTLNELSTKIHEHSTRTEEHWDALIAINHNYLKALNMYGTYMVEIKNNSQIGYELLERAKLNSNKKSLDQLMKFADVLFAEDTGVVHVSGNKGSSGRITKINQGLTKLFGYSKNEVIGHNVNVLMPSVIGRHHNDFLENFYKTGYKTVFGAEKSLFGMHRNGYCFGIKVVVKQMPSLAEGIQYVGMVRQDHSDCDYILADGRGVVDSFSAGVTTLLNLPTSLFRESEVNVQVIAPELIRAYSSHDKKRVVEKYKEPGGCKTTFMIPKDFAALCQEDRKKSVHIGKEGQSKLVNLKKTKNPLYRDFNKDVNKHYGVSSRQITAAQLLQSEEYKRCEVKQKVRCEIADLEFSHIHKGNEPIRLRTFKLIGIKANNARSISSEGVEAIGNMPRSRSDVLEFINKKSESMPREDTKEMQAPGVEEHPTEEHPREEHLREETKTTERLPGVALTTEERKETQTIQPVLKIKFRKDPATGGILTRGKRVLEVMARERTEDVKDEVQSVKGKRVNSFGSCKLSQCAPASENSALSSDKSEEQETPRMEIGSIKAPDSQVHQADAMSRSEGKQGEPNDTPSSLHKESERTEGQQEQVRGDLGADAEEEDSVEEKPVPFANARYWQQQRNPDKIQGILEVMDKAKQEEEKEKEKVRSGSKQQYLLAISKTNLSEEAKGASSDPAQCSLAPNMHSNPGAVTSKEMQAHVQRRKMYKGEHSKIITNPLYDPEGGMMEVPEYRQSDEEIRVRKAFLAFQKRSKGIKDTGDTGGRKEEEETKKLKSDEEKGEEDEEDEGEMGEFPAKPSLEEQNENQDAQSSVTSGSTASTLRSFYSLRAAIDEKYVPPSIRNIKISANLVFLILLLLAIVYHAMQITLYDKINVNSKNIDLAEQRRTHLTAVTLQMMNMLIISMDYLQHTWNPSIPQENTYMLEDLNETSRLYEEAKTKIIYHADLLKRAQIDLSLKSLGMSDSSLEKINPAEVPLEHYHIEGMPSTSSYNIYQTLLEIVISAYRFTLLGKEEFFDMIPMIYLIMKNSQDNIIASVQTSSDAIMDETINIKQNNELIFLVLLLVASIVISISTILLIPVISKIKSSKEEVLMLFMHIKRHEATNEATRCRRFLRTFQASPETEMIVAEADENQGEAQEEMGESPAGFLRNIDRDSYSGTSLRKSKALTLSLGMEIFKFVFLIFLMEGYFLMKYFLSYVYLDQALSLSDELDKLISRFPAHSFILFLTKHDIYMNFRSTSEKNPDPLGQWRGYMEKVYTEEEEIMDIFTSNKNYHTDDYNNDFETIVFGNLCEYIPEFRQDQATCEAFNKGILKKGLYAGVVKYWDFLKQVIEDFLDTNRTSLDQSSAMNNQGLKLADQMQSFYFNISLNILVRKLSKDIDIYYESELSTNLILFMVYIMYLLCVYLVFWLRFVSSMQEGLWSTKAVLSLLSPEQIMRIPEIKSFILSNSSMVLFSKAGS